MLVYIWKSHSYVAWKQTALPRELGLESHIEVFSKKAFASNLVGATCNTKILAQCAIPHY